MPGYQLPSRSLVSQQDSAMIEAADVPRSRFSGSWSRKTTFDAGYLVPFLIDEVYPGDHLSYEVTAYLRLATPLFPIFDNQRVDTFFFFVPNRLVWTHWVNLMGEQAAPGDSIAYTVPQTTNEYQLALPTHLWDYFGLPLTGLTAAVPVSALPFRAYYLIYQNWFKDENMVAGSFIPNLGDATDTTEYLLLRRGKSHDYFTSALPWAQKFTAPSIPIGTSAPVRGLGSSTNGSVAFTGYELNQGAVSWADAYINGGGNFLAFNVTTPPYADLSLATGVSINQLRQAFLVQQLLERDARGGTRYTEINFSHFRVRSPDMRLQRPEYIGGGSSPFNITPIAQTAPTSGVPLGALGAAGTASGQHRASYASTEHGMIIGLINVRSELSYQQGVPRFFSRKTRYDFYFPSLAGLGEQAILRKEIYCTGDAALDVTVFGYQERWQELRTRYSEVTGMFRSGIASTLDAWHLAQQFGSAPVLGATFVNDTPPMTRVLAAGAAADKQQYLADIFIRRDAVRPLPVYGTPALLGRF